MPPYTLLIALMASPIVGILVSLVLTHLGRIPILQAVAWLPNAVGAAVSLAAIWLLRGSSWETTIANWSPVSFTGVPLALSVTPGPMLALAAWITLYLIDSLTAAGRTVFDEHPSASALLIPALAVVALANNLITLLVGLGITDILSAYLALRRKQGEREALVDFILNALSTAGLLVTIAAHYAAGNSLSQPLAQLPQTFAPFVSLALALRLRLMPFRATSFPFADLRNSAGAVAGLIVLARLPAFGLAQLSPWFFALAAVSALATLLVGILDQLDDQNRLVAAVTTSGLYLAAGSAATGQPNTIAAATAAWLLGCALIHYLPPNESGNTITVARAARILGAACLIGLPLTIGFIGQAGAMRTTATLPALGVIALLIRVLAFALFGYALVRVALAPVHTDPSDSLPARRTGWVRPVIGASIAGLSIIVTGLTVDLGGAFSRNGIAGWLTLVVILSGAFALLWFAPVWQRVLTPPSATVVRTLRLEWLYELMSGAVGRLRAPLPRVFDLLESDSALLWAMIIALLLVLISRPAGP